MRLIYNEKVTWNFHDDLIRLANGWLGFVYLVLFQCLFLFLRSQSATFSDQFWFCKWLIASRDFLALPDQDSTRTINPYLLTVIWWNVSDVHAFRKIFRKGDNLFPHSTAAQKQIGIGFLDAIISKFFLRINFVIKTLMHFSFVLWFKCFAACWCDPTTFSLPLSLTTRVPFAGCN